MTVFNGIHLIVPDCISAQIAGDACPQGFGCWYPNHQQYFSSKFPHHLQDPQVAIHLKEFICIILAAKTWGRLWADKQVWIFCDNDSVCDVVTYMRPKDENMQMYLREFLYWVCHFNFSPTISKIGTKENDVADFLSRNFDKKAAASFFQRENLPSQIHVHIPESEFTFKANW